MKDSGVEWIGEIPEDWNISRIKYLANVDPHVSFENIDDATIITYTPMECVKNGYYEKRDTEFGSLAKSLTMFQEGDIVMAKVTPCFENGNIAIMEGLESGVGLGSSELFVFRSKNILTKYLFYWLQNEEFMQRACSTMTGAGGLKRVSPYFINNCEIHLPPISEQQKIISHLDEKCAKLDAVIEKQRASIEELQAYKLAVITEAVTKGLNPAVEMKDSGVEWIGEIPKDWTICKISHAIKKASDIDHYMPESVDEGIPYLMIGDLSDKISSIDFTTTKKISYSDYEQLCKKSKPTIGDVIFARYATIGTVCLVDRDMDFLVSYSCLTLTPNDKLSGEFLYYYLKSDTFYEEVKQFVNANTQANVGVDALKRTRIVLPPKEEQCLIIDYLKDKCESIEQVILTKKTLVDKLTAYKKSLIYEVVTGKKEV